MTFPNISGEKELLRLLRGELKPLIVPAAPGRRDIGTHPPVTEAVIESALTTIADEGGGGGIPGVLPGRIDQSLADNTTTNIVLGAVTAISRAIIDYHSIRSTDTEWGQIDLAVLQDGSTVEKLADRSWPSAESGCGLTIAGDVSGGNLRLNITTSSTGNAADFRATYRTVPA